ncbi:MAG: hypothetical protein AB8B63_06485 [Granulosicoccus sp.]
MQGTDAVKVQAVLTNTRELLESAHSIIRTFRAEGSDGDTGLDVLPTKKMLKGIEAILELANESVGQLPPMQNARDRQPACNQPKDWMFRIPTDRLVVDDVVGVACCRAQAITRLIVASGTAGSWPAQLDKFEYLDSLWAVEGIIAGAIATVNAYCPTDEGPAVAKVAA